MRIERHSPEAYTKLKALKDALTVETPTRTPAAQPQPSQRRIPRNRGRREDTPSRPRISATRPTATRSARQPPTPPAEPARRLLTLSDLRPEQREIGEELFTRAQARLRGLDSKLVEEGLARTLDTAAGTSSMTPQFFASLHRNLERTLRHGDAATARRRLQTVAAEIAQEQAEQSRERERRLQRELGENGEPNSANSHPAELPRQRKDAHVVLRPPQEVLRVLQTTNAATDFASVLSALKDLFTDLHSNGVPGSQIFLNAIGNRFALVVPEETRSAAMTTGPLTVDLSDLATLPTTRGLAIFRNRPELIAWDIGTHHGQLALITTDGLAEYLRDGRSPSIVVDDLRQRKPSETQLVRLLGGVCVGLSDPGVDNYPLMADRSRRTTREWSGKQLHRMKRPDAHRVREHLRRLPTGTITSVREHSRYGDVRWQAGDIRVQLLPRMQ